MRQQVRYGRGAVGVPATAGGALAGAGFYRRLARATAAQAGPRTAACVALAQACVAAGGRASRSPEQRRAH